MNNILALLFGVLVFAGIILIYYSQLQKLGSGRDKTDIMTETLDMTPDIERRIPVSTIIPVLDSSKSSLANPGLTLQWRMYLNAPGGDQRWTSTYARDKPIISIGNSPIISYNHKYNILKIELDYGSKSPFYSHRPTVEIPHVPLQKWNIWAIVFDSNEIKVFINGIQIVNKHLPMPVNIDTADILIGQEGNNVSGKLSNIKLYRTALHSKKLR